jgi:phosphoketolase
MLHVLRIHWNWYLVGTEGTIIEDIKEIQAEARKGKAEEATMPAWPVILFRTPKGWTGPETWDTSFGLVPSTK